MTHRTYEINGRQVEVFDTHIAAISWRKHPGNMMVLVRGSTLFLRSEDGEMTVRLNATIGTHNEVLVNAANAIADEVENMIKRDLREAALGGKVHDTQPDEVAEAEMLAQATTPEMLAEAADHLGINPPGIPGDYRGIPR
jgi:hypothetical protein